VLAVRLVLPARVLAVQLVALVPPVRLVRPVRPVQSARQARVRVPLRLQPVPLSAVARRGWERSRQSPVRLASLVASPLRCRRATDEQDLMATREGGHHLPGDRHEIHANRIA
jgi:hypothetical protein